MQTLVNFVHSNQSHSHDKPHLCLRVISFSFPMKTRQNHISDSEKKGSLVSYSRFQSSNGRRSLGLIEKSRQSTLKNLSYYKKKNLSIDS